MPTIEEIIAKRNELQKTNPNTTNVDARNALTPSSVTPTPATDVQKAINRMGGDASQRQYNRNAILDGSIQKQNTAPTVTGVNGEKFTQAPVNPETGLSAPIAPTPAKQVIPGQNVNETRPQLNSDGTPVNQTAQVAEVKQPEPVKVETASMTTPTNIPEVKPKVINPIVNRQQEIQNNLTTGFQQDPSLFTDRTNFNTAYNYDSKTPEEKATLDSFYNSKQPTISSMYSAILNKQEVPEATKLTPAYKIAQNRYTKANLYAGMTPSQLANEIKNVKLVEGSQAFEDLKAINPKLVQDATNLRKVNGGTSNIWTNNADGIKVNNLENTFASDFNDNFGEFIKSMYQIQTPEQIRAMIYTPDVKSAEDKAKAIELDINKIDDALATVDKDVDAELSGTGATGSRIALEKASRKNDLNNQRASLERNYTTYANKANNLITQNTTVFQTQQQQKQAQNAAMLPFIQKQYETAQAKALAEQALNDPATAIKSVMDEYKKLGIPFTSTVQSRLAEFKASGKTLEQFLTDMSKNIQESPAYQAYVVKQTGTTGEYSVTKIGTDANGQDIYGTFNKNTGTYTPISTANAQLISQYPNDAGLKNNNPAGLTWGISNNLKQKFIDAGVSFSQGTARPSNEGGSYIGFATPEDGIKAYQIALTTGGSDDIYSRLKQWVGTSNGDNYANQLMTASGIKKGTKFSQLTPEQTNTLLTNQIKRESPGFYALMNSGNQETTQVDSSKYPSYIKYVEGGTLPSGIKEGTPKADLFQKEAETGYIKAKNAELGASGFNILDPTAFMAKSKSQKEDIGTAIQNVQPFISSIDRLKELVKKYGTENPYSEGGKMINAEVKNAQLIAKEIYNLGVLNGPDLSLMESIIVNPTSLGANLMPWQDYDAQLESGKQKILQNMVAKASSAGLSFGNQQNTQLQSNGITNTGAGTNYGGISLPNPAGLNLP